MSKKLKKSKSAEKKGDLNRRDVLLMAGKAFVGANLGISMLSSLESVIPETVVLGRLKKLLANADSELFAQTTKIAVNPIINIVIIDKGTLPFIVGTKGDVVAGDLTGFDGANQMYKGASIAGLASTAKSWKNLSLTALFANPLAAVENRNYNIAVFPQFTSNSGGHSLQNANLGMDKGGINFVAESKKVATGLLGPVGFALQANANNSRDAFVGPNREPLQAYTSSLELVQTVKNSVFAIAKKGTDQCALRNKLDSLALKNNESAKNLVAIRDMVEPALESLQTAAAEKDLIMQQLGTIIALAKSGLASNFMLTIPWADTNGGGDLRTAGGNAGLNPYVGHLMLGEIYARLAVELPGALTILSSDGGRSRNNGDAAAGFSIVTGPADKIKSGIYGEIPSLAQLGNNGAVDGLGKTIKMSDGKTIGLLEHKHLMSMVLHMLGHDTGIAYPVDPLA